jgi:hypothetical protein
MNKNSYPLCVLIGLCGALFSADAASPAHARIVGDDTGSVEIYYPEMYTGGTQYITQMASMGQTIENADLFKGTSPIPKDVLPVVAASWKVKEGADGVLVPTGEKVNGKSPPAGVVLVSSSFYKSGNVGVYFASLMDQVAKKPYGMPVMWLNLRFADKGWEVESNKKAAKLLTNAVLTSQTIIRSGKPEWANRIDVDGSVTIELETAGSKFIRSKVEPKTIALAFLGGFQFGQPIKIDGAIPDDIAMSPHIKESVVQAKGKILDSWAAYQNGKTENATWITDVELLRDGKVTGKTPINGLQLRTAKTPPSIFYILQAKPYILVGLTFVNMPEAIQWAFIRTDKDGKALGILDNPVVLQDRETLMISSALRSMGEAW